MAKKPQKNESLTPKTLGYEVKQVNFKSKEEKKFKGAVGLCEFNEKRIYVEKTLPDKNYGSKKLCLNHELVHARVGHLLVDAGISEGNEERYVEVEAICWTGYKYLSAGEAEIKKSITESGKLNIRKKSNRLEIVSRIFSFLEIKVKEDLIKALSEKVIDRGDIDD